MPLSKKDKDHILKLEKRLEEKSGGMRYQYRYLDGDKEIFQVYHSMNQDSYTEYNGRPCEKVITSVHIITDASKPKTIGTLAERNTREMEKRGEIVHKEKDRPWWRPEKDKPINTNGMNQKQITRYITEGKI